MNKILLNTIQLDGDIVIKKGDGVKINNQSKSVEITENGSVSVTPDAGYTGLSKVDVNVDVPTQEIINQDKAIDIVENGTTEIVADSGYTGLGKVSVNVNVASSGGGGSDIPVIGDGKTYLYIKIAEKGRMDVPLYFSQTVANGVTVDWGDGSATQTLSGTGSVNTTHTYADTGEYVIGLNPADGCILELGQGKNAYSHCVMGNTSSRYAAYCNMLQAVEIGKNVINIGNLAFSRCFSLTSIVIPDSVESEKIENSVRYLDKNVFDSCYSLANIVIPKGFSKLNERIFINCYSLSSIEIPDSITSIGSYAFGNCYSLASVVIPSSVTSIGSYAFSDCSSMAFFDFSQYTSVPTLGSSVFNYITSDCKIVVPDALYDEWKAATNWSTYASYIVKASEFNG